MFLVWVYVLAGALGLGLILLGRYRGTTSAQRVGAAAAEIDGLFTPARRHVVEYHHAVEMRREDVDSADGDLTERIRVAVRREVEGSGENGRPQAG